jgi:hypothetical protein
MAPDARLLMNGYRKEVEDQRSYSPVSYRDQSNKSCPTFSGYVLT